MSYRAAADEAGRRVGLAAASLGLPGGGFGVSPARRGFGDMACNAPFVMAGRSGAGKGAAPGIAERLAARYNEDLGRGRGEGGPAALLGEASAHASGYLNLSLDWPRFAAAVLPASLRGGYGDAGLGGGRRVAVEHTSVNPNKALHIGHVRNVVVGDSVARILEKAGFEVRVLNYVDDSGLQVADIVMGFEMLGFPEEPPPGVKFDKYCGDTVYAGAAARREADPSLEAERGRVLREIERGGSETAGLAGRVTRRVLACQLETCWRLGARYDCLNFESQIVRSGMWRDAFERLKEMGLAELEEGGGNAGCWVVRGAAAGEEDKVLVRSDGTATYMAKDIPYAAWKIGLVGDPFGYEPYGAGQPGGRAVWQTVLGGGGGGRRPPGESAITVIDSRQSRLQRIVSSIMERFAAARAAGGEGGARGPAPFPPYLHLAYESVALSPATAGMLGLDTGGRAAQMSGRRGVYVGADRVLDMLAERALRETEKRNPGMDKDLAGRIAGQVAVATIRYEMARQDLDKAITFDAARSLSLEGDTAPYIQYAHARAVRVLEKAGGRGAGGADAAGFAALAAGRRERDLLLLISLFETRVAEAASNLSPKVVARYCRDLAVAFNGFYEHVRILDSADAGTAAARLLLVRSFASVLAEALGLVGAEAPPRM